MSSKTPFCKVCFDSGKPDTKHWVKDRIGKVCCPTLLALKCRLCGQCGHTVKYCSKSVAPPKPMAASVAPPKPKPVAKPEQKAPINKFDLLYDDSDEEEQAEQKKTNQQVKKQEQKPDKPPPKRWIDYDSDSDDEPLPILPIPTLKRYGHSDKTDDTLFEASM